MKAKNKTSILAVTLVLWVVAVACGLKILSDYSNTPGAAGQTAGSWPSDTAIERASGEATTLVVFLHPKCSCSRATLSELDSVMARASRSTRVYAVFVQLSGWSEAEIKGKLWRQASAIPGVRTLIDAQGKEARRFNVMTSGHVLGFDKNGRLAFSGGITASRGHAGDNPGAQAAVQLINSGQAPIDKSKVFGCSLFKAHEHKDKG